ncbi:ergothioneine biosynthesis protein EgtB [Rhodoferax sp.]|uniref:ergothioneine biosynthesis protein EgtB n=1 Tax=Rhodoferax sp. TaxID=50421 RepID=UPI00261DFCD7|nr:ergothioneine biosynthesis protein EgtB [Rhodoferax sp.]MDD2919510.1 ergothioneine biosynthesis protein EgtB [Rhodoferax sp.]
MNLASLASDYQAVRQHTLALAAPLSAEDCCVQSMLEASPAKWHLAHTTWFFETFVLERWQAGFKPFDALFRVLFNSYYNAVGDKHPRAQRGLLTRPGLDQVLAYRADVDQRIVQLLTDCGPDAELLTMVTLGLQHEQQHQELLLTDMLHLLSCNPMQPSYQVGSIVPGEATPLSWLRFDGGLVDVGHVGDGFCFDNERPQHRVFLQPYQLASRLVSNDEFAVFVAAGGYDDPVYWLAEGWDWRTAQNRAHPLYWRSCATTWQAFTLQGMIALDPHQPVRHVSYYEADAYARWASARLPTEFEWEHAALSHSASALNQLFDTAWQWTASSYAPYPGFHTAAGAVGEYNGKFMVNQYVLRGGSVATPAGHSRATYRNFFAASACWQFTGIRLASDVQTGTGGRGSPV